MSKPFEDARIRECIFADPQQERYICTAGTASLQSYLDKKKLDKGFAVLSDYSVYCKGFWRVRKKNQPESNRLIEYRIDVPEIAGVKFVRRDPSWLLGLCLFFLTLAPVLLLLDFIPNFSKRFPLTPVVDAAVCLLLGLCFLLFFLLHRKKLIQISYSNGSVLLDGTGIPVEEQTFFVRKLRELLSVWDAFVQQQNAPTSRVQAFDGGYFPPAGAGAENYLPHAIDGSQYSRYNR